MQAVLTARDLACRRGDRILFTGMGFNLSPGQGLHVTGPNGVGKSSLLRLLAGLATPFDGTVQSEGTLGLVDEDHALDPDLPLERALQFWFDIDARPHRRDIMRQLDLIELSDVPVRFLSTGQRKRAALARLVGQDAAIWLLDEPLGNLDAQSRELVDALVAGFLADGGIAVVASHQSFERATLDRLAIEEFIA